MSAQTPLEEAAEQFKSGSLLRIGDVFQTWRPGDYSLILRPSAWGWTCAMIPRGWAIGGGEGAGEYTPDDMSPWEGDVPADFAERAALDGRIVYAVDAWSTWA